MTTTAKKPKSLILYPHEVRQALNHPKLMVVRAVKGRPNARRDDWTSTCPAHDSTGEWVWTAEEGDAEQVRLRYPHGEIGDYLLAQERFEIIDDPTAYDPREESEPMLGYKCDKIRKRGPHGERWVVDYAADDNRRIKDKLGRRKWTRAHLMPSWASRLSLTLESVRVGRVQGITPEQCQLAGATVIGRDEVNELSYGHFVQAFKVGWDTHNHKTPWSDNPWVWFALYAVEVKR